ncbi:DUF1292 domain-containing protein [Alteribacter natronophilus]|uniref:DUF1292 domain-containing protein n=1 Tax=Alteribacter natronophilus TaxID=2583810 RepID=UPI00110F3F47|nr:DUF1292 domain-containing protein [Alteribacter natronophilus]TMW73945.1 DUF1292 domain-containing protein [Alteribacter natronophilus]
MSEENKLEGVRVLEPADDAERFIIPDQETGEEYVFEELFRFELDTNSNAYIFLQPEGTDNDDEEEVEVQAFRYEEPDRLFMIESEEEWEMVTEVFNTIVSDEEE